MKNNRLQCKDIPDLPILRALEAKYRAEVARDPKYPIPRISRWDLVELGAFPPDTPEKLVRAKLAMLIRRGLVDGCPCGCRGDFEITPKGLAYLAEIDRIFAEAEEVGAAVNLLERGEPFRGLDQLSAEELAAVEVLEREAPFMTLRFNGCFIGFRVYVSKASTR